MDALQVMRSIATKSSICLPTLGPAHRQAGAPHFTGFYGVAAPALSCFGGINRSESGTWS